MFNQTIPHPPRNEQETIACFLLNKPASWLVSAMGITYPDASLVIENKTFLVEFEYVSSNFISHKHNPKKCDFVICWAEDAPADMVGVPILAINKGVWSVPNSLAPAQQEIYRLRTELNRARQQIKELTEGQVSCRPKPPAKKQKKTVSISDLGVPAVFSQIPSDLRFTGFDINRVNAIAALALRGDSLNQVCHVVEGRRQHISDIRRFVLNHCEHLRPGVDAGNS